MINVFFVPGMFGSTIEYVLRSYTKENTPIIGKIQDDGSMHSFTKEFHPTSLTQVNKLVNCNTTSITTPLYPFQDAQLPEILKSYKILESVNHNILLYADSNKSAELNMLFQYHKIAISRNNGLKIFCGENSHVVVNWNPNYTSWKDMQCWELREWLSLFYVSWVQEWIESQNQVPNNFLKIKNTDMLFNTKTTLLKIIDFCELTLNDNIDSFVLEWQQKQKYIINEFDLLDKIVKSVVENIQFNWTNLNIISEAIIQQRLREKGFEIKCDGLNTFPTNSISLYNLLEKC